MGVINNPTKIEGGTKPSSIEVDGYEPLLSSARTTKISTNQQGMFDYVGGTNVIYAGYAPQGLAQGTNGWLLQKYTYDGNNNPLTRQIAYGNWTARIGYTYS